jgi:hypothetical protein
MVEKKIKLLKAELTVKNKIIAVLLHLCAEQKVPVPPNIIKMLETLYKKKISKEQTKKQEQNGN